MSHSSGNSCLGRGTSSVDAGDGHGDVDLVIMLLFLMYSDQRVPEPDPLPGISFDTRPDPIQF